MFPSKGIGTIMVTTYHLLQIHFSMRRHDLKSFVVYIPSTLIQNLVFILSITSEIKWNQTDVVITWRSPKHGHLTLFAKRSIAFYFTSIHTLFRSARLLPSRREQCTEVCRLEVFTERPQTLQGLLKMSKMFHYCPCSISCSCRVGTYMFSEKRMCSLKRILRSFVCVPYHVQERYRER